MTQDLERYYVVVGAFHDVAKLAGALDTLLRENAPVTAVCLIAESAVMAGIQRQWQDGEDAASRGKAALVAEVKSAELVPGKREVWFTAGGLGERLLASAGQADESAPRLASAWLSKDNALRLRAFVEAGAVLVLVKADGPDEQRAITKLLLRHSTHDVQTHEFSW